MATLYDEIPYIGSPFAQTHPERMATIAHLFGMTPADPSRCRVLELGCTDGGNLIPLALAMSGSTFLGIDLSGRAITAGTAVISRLKLANIELRAADIMDVDAAWGEFDFIIAHGVFSWVPAEVREQILRIAGKNLAPQGVAYISYNAQPGGHLRTLVRDMMLFHVRCIEDPSDRIAKALELISFLLEHIPDRADDYRGFLRKELEGVLERDPNVLFHDELSEVWQPVFFHEFMAQAGAQGLQFLSEANYSDTQEKTFGAAAAEAIHTWSRTLVEREQYRDFLKCRRFRQTLLCANSITLAERPPSDRVTGLYASSPATFVSDEEGVKTFEGARGSSLKTAHPVALAIIEHLIEMAPQAYHFDELSEVIGEEHRDAQAEILLTLFGAGLVQLHTWRPPMEVVPGEYPVASPLARLQAEAGSPLTTLRHASIVAQGALERKLVTLLDGTRNRAALLHELLPLSPETPEEELEGEVERNLIKVARLGLLISQ